MRRIVSLGLVAAVVGAALLATGEDPAAAHAEIRESDPEPGGTAPVGLEELELVFITMDASEPVSVAVVGPDGAQVNAGDVVVGETELTGTTVMVPVEPLEEGTHTVTWEAMSDDGDGVTSGDFEFTVDPSPGGGWGIWLIWIVALGIPAAIFLRPRGRGKRS